jgi:hypothetical protein
MRVRVLLVALIAYTRFSASFGSFSKDADHILEMHHKHAVVDEENQRIYDGEVWQELEPPFECQDLREDCPIWAESGDCEKDPRYMHPHCPVSCDTCHLRRRKVPYSETFSLDPLYRGRIFSAVGRSIGVPQRTVSHQYEPRIIELVQEAIKYVNDVVNVQDRYKSVRDLCRNHDDQCAYWAVNEECDTNEDFMIENCAPVCFACEQLHVEALCPIEPNEKQGKFSHAHTRTRKLVECVEYHCKFFSHLCD